MRTHTAYYPLLEQGPAAFAALARETVFMQARRIIVRQGEAPSQIFTLHSGWAFRFTLLPDGRRQILDFLLPGDLISPPALASAAMTFSVQALTDVTLCAFDADAFRQAMRHPALCHHLAARHMTEFAAADARITDLGRRTALERLARLILDLEDRLRRRRLFSGDGIPFPLRREHIADALGLTAVHVSRTVATLRDLGAITLVRDAIFVDNRNVLLETAGETRLPLVRT